MNLFRLSFLLSAAAVFTGCHDAPATPAPHASTHAPSPARDASTPGAEDHNGALAPIQGDSRTDQAIARAQQAVHTNPQRVRGYLDLANGFIRKARESSDPSFYQQANDAIDRALRVAPDDLTAQQLRGLVYMQDHRFRDARDLSMRLLPRSPNNPFLLGLLGDAEMEVGHYRSAEEAYQQMVNSRPNLASYSRGSWLRWLIGDSEGAVELGTHAVEAGSPRNPEEHAWTMVQLGNLYLFTGDLDHAEQNFAAALTTFANYPTGLAARGQVRQARGDLPGAITDFTQAAEANTITEHLMLLGEALSAAGRTREADEQFARLERIGRRSDPRTLALYYANHDREHQAAVDLARRELVNRPDEVYTQDVLAWALYRNGDIAEADRYSALARRVGTREARFYYHAGLIALAAGRRAEAATHLTQCLAYNPYFDAAGAREARRVLATLVQDAGVARARAPERHG